jgi:uroporphyrinogen-III decarboxylase
MDRTFFLNLAAEGLRMPIGTHLVLHEDPDHAAIELDGARLGDVCARAAGRFRTPLAVPLMDLKLEKEALLLARGVAPEAIDSFHFSAPPEDGPGFEVTPRIKATCDAIRHVAGRPGLVPLGMGIGPFSLMTKLVADPIAPVFMAGTGLTADDDPEVELVERVLEVGTALILRYFEAQIAAGAKAIIVCEPAANAVYFSPKQLAEGCDTFERYVMQPMRRIRTMFEERGVDLVFHDCGELTDGMVEQFGTLDAAMMSLGSSRALWEDAPRVPKSTVLFGNLPTKRFPAPQLTTDDVRRTAANLLEQMAATGHPFILGSECDVLSVPGSEREIMAKVEAFMDV